jgi:hypothetical protein
VNYSRNFVYIIYISLHYKRAECRASDKKCNKVGYFARVCRATEHKESQRENRKPVNRKKGKNYKVCAVAIERQSWVGEEDSRSEKKHVLSKGKDDRVLININGRKIKMVADIGCGQNIIPSQLYKDGIQFKRCPLKHTNKKFVAYGQRYPLKCLGYLEANLTAGMSSIHIRGKRP